MDVNTVFVNQIREKERLWSMSYKKDSKLRHLEKMSRDLHNLVNPEMVNKFEKSDSAQSAVGYIEQLSGTNSLDLNQSVYTLVRDYILLQITIANAHRSGVLSNMTLEEYKQAKRREESVIISVKNHKTADTHGPACAVLSPSLFSYLEMSIRYGVGSIIPLLMTRGGIKQMCFCHGMVQSWSLVKYLQPLMLRGKKEEWKGTSHQRCFASLRSRMCTRDIMK